MRLTPTQIKCLRAIKDGRGALCLKGYRFNSAAVLERNLMIEGDRMVPYWMWQVTERGRWALRQAKPR